jgi:predicted O-methyltransferase YrrM
MSPTFLDAIAPLQARVGYGTLGTGGRLGYEGKPILVQGRRFEHALSTHPPARLLYHFGGGASRFRCLVALNDDIAGSGSYADFAVVADGREVAVAKDVAAGHPPRELVADIRGAQLLELLVTTGRWECSHAVWLEPEVDGPLQGNGSGTLRDCLGYAEIDPPPPMPQVERCIATLASPGFEDLLDDMLGSLVANGNCTDAMLLVFLLGTSPACEQVIGKYRAVPVRCRPSRPITNGSKALLYSVARVVDARRYLCLDADVFVLGDLAPVLGALDVCRTGSILVSREGNSDGYRDLEHVLGHAYGGEVEDLARILGDSDAEARYPLVVNDGVFAGSREAMLALDGTLRAMPGAVAWLEARPNVSWRNQFLFNLALARLGCGVELDPTYNVQTHTSQVEVRDITARPDVRWQDRSVRILHTSGGGRHRHPELRGLYGRVPDPVVGAGDGDGYRLFLEALRAWLGRYGTSGLERSFYGTWERDGGRVRDPSTFPVLALLHYLVRACGAVRMLETGTMRGVSAACLASAVAHRPGGRVVSFDPHEYPGRQELWSTLPGPMRDAIEPRRIDSIDGMRAALVAGERYDAALLDSLHTEEHLWGELEIAARLVPPGAPILTHDWRWEEGVQRVLDRARAAGYGVVRLVGPGGVEEESGLGIAVIENRRPE